MTNINLVFNFPLAGSQAQQADQAQQNAWAQDQMQETQEEQAQQNNVRPLRN